MAWRSSIARSIHCGASKREKICALIISTIRSLANKLTFCSPMHDLLGRRIRGASHGSPGSNPGALPAVDAIGAIGKRFSEGPDSTGCKRPDGWSGYIGIAPEAVRDAS